MRLPFQSHTKLYEVYSEIKYDKRGVKKYRTYYGGEFGSKDEILRIAKENIERKFETSGGKIVILKIINVYQ